MNSCILRPLFLLLSLNLGSALQAQDPDPDPDPDPETAETITLSRPLASTSDQIGGLRNYGPVQINDVTGKVTVTLPRIGPSELLSVQPHVTTRLDDYQHYLGSFPNMRDQFDALGTGGSIGWGYFWVTDPLEYWMAHGQSQMTYYQRGGGSPVDFTRDYLFQTSTTELGLPELFNFQNTLDTNLRRMCWQNNGAIPLDGDYLLLEPGGRKITFRSRKWSSSGGSLDEWLYYPSRVEDPSGESVDIHYFEDENHNQLAMMKYMEDKHGRKLRFIYELPISKGQLKEIRLLTPDEDPETGMGLLLAQFTYADNGMTGRYGEPLKSLASMTDAMGYQWHLEWGTNNPKFELKKVSVPEQGVIDLTWEQKTINYGRLVGEIPIANLSWRVTKVQLGPASEGRAYTYSWTTESDPTNQNYLDVILNVTINGPEELSQVTKYNNFPSKINAPNGQGSPVHVENPTSGYPFFRQTNQNGGVMVEEWQHEPVFLWSTPFQPPRSGLHFNPAGNALTWAVRLRKYRSKKDGLWHETEYHYPYNHPWDRGPVADLPSKSILAPDWIEQRSSNGQTKYRRQFAYENRVTTDNECHYNPALQPYQLNLVTDLSESFDHPDTGHELISKTSTSYELADLPFPTQKQEWAGPNEAVQTHYEYYLSGSHRGKLKLEYVGANPAQGFQYLDYGFGEAKTIRPPIGPDTVHEIDYRGNLLSTTEAGITTTFEYDLADRLVKTLKPTMLDAISQYSPPLDPEFSSPERYRLDYYEDGAAQWQQSRVNLDEWGRATSSETQIKEQLFGQSDVTYNLQGQVAATTSASGSTKTYLVDVFDRPLLQKTYDDGGTLIETLSYAYTAQDDGSHETCETLLRDGQTSVKKSRFDMIGRLLFTSLNATEQGPGSSLESDDYAGGGSMAFTFNQNPTTSLNTTTMYPYPTAQPSGSIPLRKEVRDWLGRLVTVTDPEYGGGSISYQYNDRGLLSYSTQADGKKYQYLYDEAARLLEQRQRTSLDPERFELVVVSNSYHPIHGYMETQVKKLETSPTRTEIHAKDPDALGRPSQFETQIAEPQYWDPGLTRTTITLENEQEAWLCQWNQPSLQSGLATEYILELKPIDGERVSLFFPEIHLSQSEDPYVSFTLDNQQILAAINSQLVNHKDRQIWLNEAQLGTTAQTVLDPNRAYRFRVTAIDSDFHSTQPSYWWGDLPDLLVDSIDVDLVGSQLALDFRIFNAGTKLANASTTEVYLSATPTLDAEAQPILSFATPVILPGFAALHSAPQINRGQAAYVIIAIDTTLTNIELDENNNTGREFLAYQGQFNPNFPDVVVEEMNWAYVALGANYETYATYAIQNQNPSLATSADGSGGNSTTHLYYSSDNVISNDDLLLATPECGALGPMAREIQTTSLGLFNQAIPLHSTHLVAAANSGVDEQPRFEEDSNTFNNVATIELPQLTGLGPDLVVAQFLHQGVSGTPGHLTTNLTFTIYNRGVWEAAPSHVGFYYSSDPLWGPSDQRLTLTDGSNSVAIDRIYPGWDEQIVASASLVLPSQTGYLIVYADVDNEIVESDETANWKSQSFQGYADLVFENVQYNASSQRYSLKVRNAGNLAAEASVVNAYLDFGQTYRPTQSSFVLNAFSIPTLSPGQVTTSYSTPAGWVPPLSNRDTYLFFVADAGNAVHERDETNNISTAFFIPGTGQAGGKPDLVPDHWGFTHDIWPDLGNLTSPDLEISRPRVEGQFLSYRYRAKVGSLQGQAQIEIIFSNDASFGSADDRVTTYGAFAVGDADYSVAMPFVSDPSKDFVRMRILSNFAESSAVNNTVYTQQSLPYVMAVHSITNQSNVGCGPSTTAVYMSRDNHPTVSPGDDLISLYLSTGFDYGGTMAGPMIDYNGSFMSTFKPLSGWYMKFVTDALDVVDESDETNNVLVVDPDPSHYTGPYLPKGLPPLPDPGPGAFTEGANIDRSTAATSVQTESFRSTLSQGLYDLSFRLKNHGGSIIPVKNLSIFASNDLNLQTNAKLIFSSLLVGDLNGKKSYPSSIPAYETTTSASYRLRVPAEYLGSQYKLIFVINADKTTRDDKRPFLNFASKNTKIVGFLEPAYWGSAQ